MTHSFVSKFNDELIFQEVHERAIQSLAEVTSKAVEQFHKAGELVLLQKDEGQTFLHRAQNLAR